MTDRRIQGTPILLLAVLAMLALTPSCTIPLIHKKKAVPAPPPAPAAAAPAAPVKQPVLVVPVGPEFPSSDPDLSQMGPVWPPEPLPPAPRRRSKPRPRQEEEADAPPAAPPEQPAAQVPLPRFEQILTPEERQNYNEEIDKDIAGAQRAVAALEAKRLDTSQTTYLARVRVFIDQANQARRSDLFRARNLAERARVLAEDLLKSVQ